jgi:SAM-dependent methyltransferase
MTSKLIDNSLLICPDCKSGNLVFTHELIHCNNCNKEYNIFNDKYFFINPDKDNITDSIDRFKYFFKKYTWFYSFMFDVISPVYQSSGIKTFIKAYVNNKNVIALNLGSGNRKLSDNLINIDIFPYENVHLICDIKNIPFADNSVDIIMNIVVLEHVADPEKVVSEIHRVLKPGGLVFSCVPFIQPYHVSPFDFSRRTSEGVKVLHKDFELIEIKSHSGPTSALLWVFQEWIALLLSFGIRPVHDFLYLLIMIITFPIKYLDFLLIKHPLAKNISSAFIYIGRKNRPPAL